MFLYHKYKMMQKIHLFCIHYCWSLISCPMDVGNRPMQDPQMTIKMTQCGLFPELAKHNNDE